MQLKCNVANLNHIMQRTSERHSEQFIERNIMHFLGLYVRKMLVCRLFIIQILQVCFHFQERQRMEGRGVDQTPRVRVGLAAVVAAAPASLLRNERSPA